MVYYGAVSRGCQRCRQRKTKCDQRKPECLKCENSQIRCPGYRDLHEVLFRDESARIIQKARKSQQSCLVGKRKIAKPHVPDVQHTASTSHWSPLPASSQLSIICRPLSQSADELGAGFFFSKYTFKEIPFSSEYHEWLADSYRRGYSNHTLRASIEAVGLAGISNISLAPHVASKSKEQYHFALWSMQEALNDPVRAVADTTFMAVILLGLFETINFETWDRYHSWAAHVHGAMLLLELRGQEQFTRQLGGLLYVQIRSQILLACIQQRMTVPPALVQIASSFRASATRQRWQERKVASPDSLSEISFRIVNLSAILESGDPQRVRNEALAIEVELEMWVAGIPPSWAYASIKTIDNSDADIGINGNMQHVYPTLWIAEVWNNWRVLRILVNQAIIQTEVNRSIHSHSGEQTTTAISLIRQLSTDLCLSVPTFKDSPRILSLIRPIYVIALEELNPRSMRLFAVEQLRRIGASMGIRQACLLAETVSKSLDGSLRDVGSPMPHHVMIPLIPCG